MSSEFVQWEEVLGLTALGLHQVMRTFGIEGVITGWSISGLQFFRVGLCHELG